MDKLGDREKENFGNPAVENLNIDINFNIEKIIKRTIKDFMFREQKVLLLYQGLNVCFVGVVVKENLIILLVEAVPEKV